MEITNTHNSLGEKGFLLELPLPSLSEQRVLQKDSHHIELYPSHLIWECSCLTEEPNSLGVWEETHRDSRWVIRKEALTSLDCIKMLNAWKVSATIDSSHCDFVLYLKKKEEAQFVYSTLYKYMFEHVV